MGVNSIKVVYATGSERRESNEKPNTMGNGSMTKYGHKKTKKAGKKKNR